MFMVLFHCLQYGYRKGGICLFQLHALMMKNVTFFTFST